MTVPALRSLGRDERGLFEVKRTTDRSSGGTRIATRLAFLLIVAGAAWFFFTELKDNWVSLRLAGLRFHAGGMLTALGMVIASYLVAGVAWYYGINAYPSGERTSLGTSMAVINITQMTKYLPGKVWSYALQMFLMEGRGIPRTYVLYVNLLVTLSMLSIAGILGLLYLAFFPHPVVPRILSVPLFCSAAAAYGGLLFLNGTVMQAAVRFFDRIFRTDAEFFEVPLPVLLRMQVWLFVSSVLFGLAACAVCYGIGWAVPAALIFPVSAATLFSDLLGFVMVLAPGGLGIREGAMFILLNDVTGKNIALLLPLAVRAVTLASDLILGVSALILFRRHMLK